MFTLDQLEVFEAILRTGGFAAAARDLGRATSAVSYAVKTLETTLDITLFDRSQRHAKLTPAGTRVEQEIRQILDRVHRLRAVGEQIKEGWEPRLEIVADGVFPLPPLMRALRRFSEERIPTQIQLMIEYLGGVPERFQEDEADLMLALDFENDGSLHSTPLPDIEMVLVAHRDHPLHTIQAPITLQTLKTFTELIVADSGSTPAQRPKGLRFYSGTLFELSDFHSKREALLGGVGFGWLPHHLAQEPLKRGILNLIDYEEGNRLRFAPFFVRRRSTATGRGAKLFTRILLGELGQKP